MNISNYRVLKGVSRPEGSIFTMTTELLPVTALCKFLFHKLKNLNGKDLMT
jgi:hypothetical protein